MTEILIQKSEQNHTAFLLLLDKKLYASAIHCGYYSCLQKTIYIMDEYQGENLDYINNTILPGKKKGNLHGYCIKEISALIKKWDRADAAEIMKKLKELKELRVQSDYNKIDITADLATRAQKHIEKVHYIIKKHLSL